MVELLCAIEWRDWDGVLAGTGGESFYVFSKTEFVEYGLDGAPTGAAFSVPRYEMAAASPKGDRLAFARKHEISVVDRSGREILRADFQGNWIDGGDMTFDRSGITLWLSSGPQDERVLHAYEVQSGRTASQRMGYDGAVILRPDWGRDAAIFYTATSDAGTLVLTDKVIREGRVDTTWNAWLPDEDQSFLPLHFADGRLLGVRCESGEVWSYQSRGAGPTGDCLPGLRGAHPLALLDISTVSAGYIAFFGHAAVEIYDSSLSGEPTIVPAADGNPIIKAVLLAGNRVLVVTKAPEHHVAEVWSF